MLKGKLLAKQKLTLVKVLDEKPYGDAGKTLQPFTVRMGDLAFCRVVSFSETLTEYIKKLALGSVFVADVEERPQDDPEQQPNRSIQQVYDAQGNPVAQRGRPGGGGGGGGYRSAETVRLEYELKAQLLVINEAGDLLRDVGISSTFFPQETRTRLWGKYLQVVEQGLDRVLGSKPIPAQISTDSRPISDTKQSSQPPLASSPSGAPPATARPASQADKDFENLRSAMTDAEFLRTLPQPKTLKELSSMAYEFFGLMPSDIAKEEGFAKIDQVTDLAHAWQVLCSIRPPLEAAIEKARSKEH